VLLQEVSTIDFANYWNLMLQFFRLSRKAAINFDKPAIHVKKIQLQGLGRLS